MKGKKTISRREFLKGMGAVGLGLGLGTHELKTPLAQAAKVAAAPTLTPVWVKPTTLVVTVIPGTEADHLISDAEAFMQAYPEIKVTVNVAGGAEEEYKGSFPQIAISSDRPDVAWYWVDGRQYQDLVAGGALEPLDDLYEREGWEKVLPEASVSKYTSPDGHRYAVNCDIVWYPQVYYNKKAFEKAGVEPPKNHWYESTDEWYGVVDKLRAAGYEPVTYGGKEGWIIGHTHDTLLQRMVPQELLDDLYNNWRPGWEPKIHYTDEKWLAVDKMLLEWYNKGVFAEGYLGRSYPEGRALFVQEKAAMYQDGSWAPSASILYKEAPDLDFGWMLYPRVKGEITPKFLLYAGNGIMIPKNPKDLDVAKEFVAFVMSKERQTALAENKILVPSRTDVPPEALEGMGPHVYEMWKLLPVIGTSTGWDDPVPADLAERSFILFQEMLTGMRTPETVGEELEKLAERHRKK